MTVFGLRNSNSKGRSGNYFSVFYCWRILFFHDARNWRIDLIGSVEEFIYRIRTRIFGSALRIYRRMDILALLGIFGNGRLDRKRDLYQVLVSGNSAVVDCLLDNRFSIGV